MTEKKKFLLRIDANLYAALEKWAADDLRSINAQIEFILSNALKKAGRQSSVRSGMDDSNKKQKE
ncbi:MAG TPA: hypothetical protein VLB50_07960 [Ignavibacteriaceae bacterium]|nr:hypothetical protein [Ignavibacteriaceae bacterium]